MVSNNLIQVAFYEGRTIFYGPNLETLSISSRHDGTFNITYIGEDPFFLDTKRTLGYMSASTDNPLPLVERFYAFNSLLMGSLEERTSDSSLLQ